MAYKKDEITLAADIPIGLFEAFDKQRSDRKQVKKGALAGAINLWISLPSDVQAQILHQQSPQEAYSIVLGKVLEQLTNLNGKISEKYAKKALPQKNAIAFHELTQKLLKMTTKDYTTAIRYLMPEEQAIINEVRRSLKRDKSDIKIKRC